MSASPQPHDSDPSRPAEPSLPDASLRHDVRTALTVIRGYAQLAQRRGLAVAGPERWMLAAWLRAIDASAGAILERVEQWERNQRG